MKPWICLLFASFVVTWKQVQPSRTKDVKGEIVCGVEEETLFHEFSTRLSAESFISSMSISHPQTSYGFKLFESVED